MKIGLGTAQLSKNYGLLKQKVAKMKLLIFLKFEIRKFYRVYRYLSII